MDFFITGDKALQSYACDTFSLGLCFVHLLTGRAPYEEILARVRCPPKLMSELKSIWKKKPSKRSNQTTYTILKELLSDDPDDILSHTFYRYLVLFGLPSSSSSATTFSPTNPVWNVLSRSLSPSLPQARRRRDTTAIRARFQVDVDEFSLATGTHPAMVQARARCDEIPGLWDIVMAMVSPDPNARPTMKHILESDVFDSIRTPSEPEHNTSSFVFLEYVRDELKNI